MTRGFECEGHMSGPPKPNRSPFYKTLFLNSLGCTSGVDPKCFSSPPKPFLIVATGADRRGAALRLRAAPHPSAAAAAEPPPMIPSPHPSDQSVGSGRWFPSHLSVDNQSLDDLVLPHYRFLYSPHNDLELPHPLVSVWTVRQRTGGGISGCGGERGSPELLAPHGRKVGRTPPTMPLDLLRWSWFLRRPLCHLHTRFFLPRIKSENDSNFCEKCYFFAKQSCSTNIL